MKVTADALAQVPGPLLIIGAAYSGKSEIAIRALDAGRKTTVIGSAVLQEALLQERVKELQAMRPAHWETVDADLRIAEQLRGLLKDGRQVLFDSFNLWLANALLNDMQKYDSLQLVKHFEYEVRCIADVLKGASERVVLVSSEAGAGVSPPQEPARLFRQILGHAHVALARTCPSVAWITAGLIRLEKSDFSR